MEGIKKTFSVGFLKPLCCRGEEGGGEEGGALCRERS
jgi:hypothetical protein